ncbi:type II toxin-antitoxin system HigB family toxin [Burkholderia cenocepacia]|uniref:type II toxin-antitoxin system HigB family toxin n=1 Tax=Burkholderia cenocepacia TaxID=95486 RepID=UPI0004853175|nr:type II toxin-antitoxin system HigB family toxin [Burkholderia cenocepacia]KOR17469.1 toxin RelE [Burkholderia cenocepacia]MBR7983212.1 type II toxin-antitoxin system HigB family toxin [Burkholderia cenocepacia]MBR7992629.1 type II toxin-antitoxin system HigB family toxin [Burkholderia cenocepacia]
MRIVALRTLLNFIAQHAQAEQALLAWHAEAAKANWKTPQNIKDQYASVSFIGRNRVAFNIKGNDFRLIVAVAYQIGVVYVKFVGTYAEYDKVDAATVEME